MTTIKENIADKLFQRFNNGFDKLTQGYTNVLSKFATRTTITFGLLFLFIGLTWATSKFYRRIYSNGRSGMAYVSVTTPQGATVERTEKFWMKLPKWLKIEV